MTGQLYLRYVLASAMSLGTDMALFMAGLAVGVPPAMSAALGYCAGVVCHWFVSSRVVFVGRVVEGAARWHQQMLFAASALAGLAITTAIVGLGSGLGLDPKLAKLVAIAASFQATFLLRKKWVFA